MSLATFSYLLSAIELLFAVPLLVSPAKSAQWLLKLNDDDAILRLVGALIFVICFLALSGGLALGLNVAGLIRLMAILGVIKGLLICWFPQLYARRVELLLSQPAIVRAVGAVALVAAVLLLLAGNYLAATSV